MSRTPELPLRSAIRERFEGESLRPEQLAQLRALLQPAAAVRPADASLADPTDGVGSVPNRSRRRLFAIAASVAATATVGYWGSFGLRAFNNASNLDALAEEVAYNHLFDKPMDVVSGSMDELRQAFASVGFMLQAPPIALPGDAELIGGRHCSIAAVPAVMLRYRTAQGVLGFCQARFDPARHRGVPDMAIAHAPVERMARGLKVSLCHDMGVLMALATV
jgi:anti-sigma factor RsiW